MKKVCHLTSVHDSTDVRIFQKECVSLAKNGYCVFLVAKGKSRVDKNVNVIGLGKAPHNRIKRILFFTKKVYKIGIKLNCDIYHLHDPELLPVAMKLKKRGKIVIFDSHEKYTEQIKNKPYIPVILRNIIATIYELYEWYILRHIDCVIFPCLCNGKHPFEKKCNIVETIDNFPILKELYNNYNENAIKDKRSACYVGSISENRGITNFIKSIYLAKGVANIGGKFDSENYKNKIKMMQEYSCVKYFGVLTRTQVFNILQQSIIGMANLKNMGQYNKYDNLPTKVYEYMSLAMPVILSKSNYNCKIMKKFNFGICVDPDNIAETANAMEYIFNNPDIAKKMGESGRNAIKNYFNWENESKKLINLYKKLLSKGD